MPVSAANNTQFYSYNGVILPALPEWDKEKYPYALIVDEIINEEINLYLFDRVVSVSYPGYAFQPYAGYTATSYEFNQDSWDLIHSNVENAKWYFGSNTQAVWSNFVFSDSNGKILSNPSDPIPVFNITGRMVFRSNQVGDDFVSCVLQITDLSDTTAAISLGYKLYSGGVELRSVLDDESFTGSNGYIIHSTLLNLDPETEYEIIYTLYANGEPTEITASITFTTLASSGSGGGSDPDYSGQLDGIQQGMGEIQDSVDDVGSKVDGIQDTLTETKEEITSLPGKIASAILDGIKSLFVPSEEDLTEIKDKYENMLSEKLGFVWQAFDLLTTFVGDLQTSLESGEAYEFNFPGVKLPMQGEEFVLVPETAVSLDNGLMDVLRPVLGTVISMIAVIAFVNMAHDYVLAIISGVSAYQFERRKE